MQILRNTQKRFDTPVEPEADGVIWLDCWQDYLVEFEPGEPDAVPGTAILAEFDVSPRRVTLNFGDYVGELQLGDSRVRVCSSKLKPEGFDRLLTAITDRISDLPFDFNAPTFIPFGREGSESRDVLYQAFVYLRWAMSDECHRAGHRSLKESWAQIAADPHRTLIRSERWENPWDARGVSPRTLEKIASHPELWRPVSPNVPAYESALAEMLEEPVSGTRYVPEKVVEVVAETCLDNPENRFAKYFARTVSNIASEARELLARKACDPSLVRAALSLARETQQMERAHFLRDVAEMRHFPASSQVLQKRGPYRDLLRHHQALRLASNYPISGDDLRLIIESKSASTLYEYWCFFEAAAAVESVHSLVRQRLTPQVSEVRTDLEQGMRFEYGTTAELHFNRTFARHSTMWSSYSVTLRPDIVLRTPYAMHLFDAKFRVQTWGAEEDTAASLDALEDADRTGRVSEKWWKNADIHKMHAYRDALGSDGTQVQTVWVLYPGDKFVFYETSGRKITDADDFEAGMMGVGAIPLDPVKETGDLRTVIGKVLG